MKTFLLMLLFITSSASASLFGPSKEEKERLQHTEQQLAQQQHATGTWQVIAGIATIGAISLLFIGAALGSRIRRHEHTDS